MTAPTVTVDSIDRFGDHRDLLTLCALTVNNQRMDWAVIARAALRYPGHDTIARVSDGLLIHGITEKSGPADTANRILAEATPVDWERAHHKAETELGAAAKVGARLVTTADADLPIGVRSLVDLPPFIFVQGHLNQEQDSYSLAVVGTRRPSPAALGRTEWGAQQLTTAGVTVISGLAAGIDTAAHRATLNAGGRTVAVAGTGISHCYPTENKALAADIIASGGAILSPFWPTQRPDRWTFPARNRVTVAIAQGTLVVEAAARSGSSQTARQTMKQRRNLFFPGTLLDHQPWAAKLAVRDNVYRVDDAEQDMINRLIPAARRRTGSHANAVAPQLL